MKPNLVQAAGTALLSLALIAQGQEDLRGVFSNNAEGFDIATLMIHETGYAYFHAAVAGVIGEWSFDKATSVLTVKFLDSGNSKERSSIGFLFDPKQRSYTFVDGDYAKQRGATKTLRYVTNAIPDKLVAAFKVYPDEVRKQRQQLKAREEYKRKEEERLARERPEYERIRNVITNDPKVVISSEFFVREDTPATRALKSTLGDLNVKYPESVLVDLLNELPPDNHWIRAMIFSRPELTAGTIEKFYPKALEWGAHLNYGILANIGGHPNTPRQLIEDLASRADLPVGATRPAQRRLKQIRDEQNANHTSEGIRRPADGSPKPSM